MLDGLNSNHGIYVSYQAVVPFCENNGRFRTILVSPNINDIRIHSIAPSLIHAQNCWLSPSLRSLVSLNFALALLPILTNQLRGAPQFSRWADRRYSLIGQYNFAGHVLFPAWLFAYFRQRDFGVLIKKLF